MIPKSAQKDTVIIGPGKAKLEDTLQLMQLVVRETLNDSQKLAVKLRGHNVTNTCHNIWIIGL
ncbi:hypothetical protein [uncultured Aquimarina sp.]|uniref:hypothetical protein n=1 Tax=uncultured Aquimarina sp. TaxID=575652 RepID=UPI0026341CEB|nr:hypothetical protein [uncultured Aquimarina sp.]